MYIWIFFRKTVVEHNCLSHSLLEINTPIFCWHPLHVPIISHKGICVPKYTQLKKQRWVHFCSFHCQTHDCFNISNCIHKSRTPIHWATTHYCGNKSFFFNFNFFWKYGFAKIILGTLNVTMELDTHAQFTNYIVKRKWVFNFIKVDTL